MSTGLNPAQEEAVLHTKGPLLVLAGAGSGKTRVITTRIAHLVNNCQVYPQRILAVTFTNKASKEMAERLEPLVGKERGKKLWVSTFHSFGVRFLTEEAQAAFPTNRKGKGRFVVFDQADCMGLVKEIMKREGIGDRDLDLWSVHARISLWKNKGIRPQDIRVGDFEYDAIAGEIYPHYEAGLKSMHAFDFDDLVAVPVRVLQERDDLREKWRGRFDYVLVDEFQDTNAIQLDLLKQLVPQGGNICVVGDDDQSIYGWRGAEVSNILDFDKIFNGAKLVKLETNYRSTTPILEIANKAIDGSASRRLGKTLRAAKPGGEQVRMCELGDPTEEAAFIAREIKNNRAEGKLYKDIAILYRSNQQSLALEEEFRAAGIPFAMIGGSQVFDRKETKDCVAYLRAVVNPLDELSMRRILNYPSRGIGDTTVDRITRYSMAHGLMFSEALSQIDRIPDVPDVARRGARQLAEMLEDARQRLQIRDGSIESIARKLFERAGLKGDLSRTPTKAEEKKWKNVEWILGALTRYETKGEGDRPSLTAFLQRISLQKDGEEEEEDRGNAVTLSTLHGSKGLEWDVVYFIGLNEGTLPHLRTIDPKVTEAAPTDVDEERRLFYVGVTRARKKLYLCRPRRKELRGKESQLFPSRFLQDLPEEHLMHIEDDRSQTASAEETMAYSAALLDQLRGFR